MNIEEALKRLYDCVCSSGANLDVYMGDMDAYRAVQNEILRNLGKLPSAKKEERKISIESICKNGIYIPYKNYGKWDILNIVYVYYAYSEDDDRGYFSSPMCMERSFFMEEADKTWFTTYEKALDYCKNNVREPVSPIETLKKHTTINIDCDRHDPACGWEGIDFSELDDDEYNAVLNWIGLKKYILMEDREEVPKPRTGGAGLTADEMRLVLSKPTEITPEESKRLIIEGRNEKERKNEK